MWKEYSLNYLKKNKSTAAFIVIAIFVASMFISLLSTLFYNMWTNDIDRIKASEGDWQARIHIALSTDEMDTTNETSRNSRNCGNKKNSTKNTGSKNTHKDEMDRY